MNLGEKFLQRLMERAENTWARSDVATASILFSEKGNPEYFNIRKATDKQDYHGVLLHAKSQGAILIEWDITAGYQNQVKRVVLADGVKLASLLNLTPRWEALSMIRQSFSPYITQFPILEMILDAWKSGRKPRSLGISDESKILDAIKTINQCQQLDQQDIPIRRMSARLGFDTKHLEAIIPALDLLTSTDINALPREKDEIFAELGLVKHPSPVMITGCLSVQLNNADDITIPFPYLGLPPSSVTGIKVDSDCKMILSIENLTTFHELTQLNHLGVILIYSNGMPSPSWRKFYELLIRNSPPQSELYHWGDVDAGGYRIARNIFEVAKSLDRKIKLHCMNPNKLPLNYRLRELDSKEITEMQKIAVSCEWYEEQSGISKSPYAFEQEILDLSIPLQNY
ncbi:MAG: DUF2220 family protein [Methylotenera sp.]|jgi:hypothetical protein|nr:DUF2220 family protein [Methylotenera sp.]